MGNLYASFTLALIRLRIRGGPMVGSRERRISRLPRKVEVSCDTMR